MRRARARERSAAEESSAQVGTPAARARDNPLRGPVERCQPRADHTRLLQNPQSAIFALDMQLVTRLTCKGVTLIRPNLGRDPQLAKQPEGAARRSRAREIEVECDLPATL
jgi:hypothetical protein